MGKAEKLKRIRDIQRRKEQRRKKRMMTNAVIFSVAAVILVIIAVSCRGRSEKMETKTVEVTSSPAVTAPAQTKIYGDYRDFYANSAFIGNSFIDGMEIYEFFDDADYFAKVGLNVSDAMTEAAANGVKPVIEELSGDRSYDKIFMMFGENELGWKSTQTFVDQYKKLVKKAKNYQPNAEIYLLSITPVSKKVSEQAIDETTNENIVKFNKLIEEVARSEDAVYCNIHRAVANGDGELPEDAASDGIHFTKKYYEKCLTYISENYGGNPSPDKSSNGEPETSSQPRPTMEGKNTTVTSPKSTSDVE